MVDMVRKHTVPGTGNFRTIDQMFNRAIEMLSTSRHMERSFVSSADYSIIDPSDRRFPVLIDLKSSFPHPINGIKSP